MQIERIELTDGERRSERLADTSLEQAKQALERDGAVVLGRAVASEHLDRLYTKMESDAERLIRSSRVFPSLVWTAAGRRPGHLQLSYPNGTKYAFRDVLANPWATQLTSSVLGSGAFFGFPTYSCNVNCPGSEAQPVHYDPAPPMTLAVNIALRDVDENNGAIELWPGTHRVESQTPQMTPEELDQRRAEQPAVRGATRKGDVLVRSLSVWHRGMPNPSANKRHMLVSLHFQKDADSHPFFFVTPKRFDPGLRQVFEDLPLDARVKFGRPMVPSIFEGPLFEVKQRIVESRTAGRVRRVAERVGNAFSTSK